MEEKKAQSALDSSVAKQRGEPGPADFVTDDGLETQHSWEEHWPSPLQQARDLRVVELDEVGKYLGIAGSLNNYRPLHEQHVLLRKIIPAFDTRLHLLWFDRIVYIKPLPECLLDLTYVEKMTRRAPELRGPILGFLASYRYMVKSPLDLAVAHEAHLIPQSVSFADWLRWCKATTRLS